MPFHFRKIDEAEKADESGLSIVRSHELELVLNRFGLSRVEGPVGILCIEGDFNIPGVVKRLSIPLPFVAIFSPMLKDLRSKSFFVIEMQNASMFYSCVKNV